MADATFEFAFKTTLGYEGGYSDNSADPGGATNLGVTIGTLSKWLGRPVTKAEVRALTPAAVKPIYRKNYWLAAGCDKLEPGVDFVVYDGAVNSGPARSLKWLPGGTKDPLRLVKGHCAARRSFLQALRTFSVFGKGWLARVAKVEAAGVKLTMDVRNVTPPVISAVARVESKDAAAKVAARTKQASSVAGAGAGTGGASQVPDVHAALGGHSGWVLAAIIAVAAVSLIVILWHRQAQKHRAAAFAEIANA